MRHVNSDRGIAEKLTILHGRGVAWMPMRE